MALASPSGVDTLTVAHRRRAAGVVLVLGLVAGVLAAAGTTTGALGVVRAVSTVTFMVLGPGWAVAGFLRGALPALAWTVAVAVGCATGALGAQTMLALGWWHPELALGLLVLVCAAPLGRHVVGGR